MDQRDQGAGGGIALPRAGPSFTVKLSSPLVHRPCHSLSNVSSPIVLPHSPAPATAPFSAVRDCPQCPAEARARSGLARKEELRG